MISTPVFTPLSSSGLTMDKTENDDGYEPEDKYDDGSEYEHEEDFNLEDYYSPDEEKV